MLTVYPIETCSQTSQSHSLSGSSGRIRMTGDDTTYNLDCSWHINADPGQVPDLVFRKSSQKLLNSSID